MIMSAARTNTGDLIPIAVLIVLSVHSGYLLINVLHLQGLKLAHPITTDHNFQVSLLIGADHYWSFVQDHIVRGDSTIKAGIPIVWAITLKQSVITICYAADQHYYYRIPRPRPTAVLVNIETIATNTNKPDLPVNKYLTRL